VLVKKEIAIGRMVNTIVGICGIFAFTMLSIPYFLGEIPSPSWQALQFIMYFSLFELLLMKIVPSGNFIGPVTPKGNKPVYKDTGFTCFVITVISYLWLVYSNLLPKDYLIQMYPALISTLNIVGVVIALLLYIKGVYYPTCPHKFCSNDDNHDAVVTNNFITDYYVGVELHPELFGEKIKVFTNCRFGMTLWFLLLINCVLTRPTPNVIVSAIIMGTYLVKFFYWETGYYTTLDIAHDRCGYYICYGCIAFLPLIYISPVYYQVYHTGITSLYFLVPVCVIGLLLVYLNYDVDRQKQNVKIQQYKGLSTVGWWGVARKINYTFEILLTLCWCLPAGFNSITPYIYFIYIVLVLLHRTQRDEKRCHLKYGNLWLEYKNKVPYIFIPGIY